MIANLSNLPLRTQNPIMYKYACQLYFYKKLILDKGQNLKTAFPTILFSESNPKILEYAERGLLSPKTKYSYSLIF